jgi:hypothetical protein
VKFETIGLVQFSSCPDNWQAAVLGLFSLSSKELKDRRPRSRKIYCKAKAKDFLERSEKWDPEISCPLKLSEYSFTGPTTLALLSPPPYLDGLCGFHTKIVFSLCWFRSGLSASSGVDWRVM